MMFRRVILLSAALFPPAAGCVPSSAPVVQGPIDTETASKLQGRVRISNGDKYSVTHRYGDEEFEANWELGNAFKKNAQLQFKPPGSWSDTDVYQALEVVLAAHESKPWYAQIDETVLRCFRDAVKDTQDHRSVALAPDTPYKVAVKANQYEKEWFVEVKVQILDENGMALGI